MHNIYKDEKKKGKIEIPLEDISIWNFSMKLPVGLVEMNEEIKNDESEGDGEGETETTGETQIDEVTYLLFINSKKVYKIEVLRNGVVSEYAQPIKLSSTDVEAATGLLVGEVVGNNVYIMAKRLDDNKKVTDFIYLHKILPHILVSSHKDPSSISLLL